MDPIHPLIDAKTELFPLTGAFKANKQSGTPERETEKLKLRKRASKGDRQDGGQTQQHAYMILTQQSIGKGGET